MYVCICRAVTDEQIRSEIQNGACSLGEVCQRLGVATGCGRCRDFAAEFVEETLCQCPSAVTASAA